MENKIFKGFEEIEKEVDSGFKNAEKYLKYEPIIESLENMLHFFKKVDKNG